MMAKKVRPRKSEPEMGLFLVNAQQIRIFPADFIRVNRNKPALKTGYKAATRPQHARYRNQLVHMEASI